MSLDPCITNDSIKNVMQSLWSTGYGGCQGNNTPEGSNCCPYNPSITGQVCAQEQCVCCVAYRLTQAGISKSAIDDYLNCIGETGAPCHPNNGSTWTAMCEVNSSKTGYTGKTTNLPPGPHSYCRWIDAGPAVPIIQSASTVNAQVGSPLNFQVTAENAPSSYTFSSLPVGLSGSTVTGAIQGTPTVIGQSTTTITATNSAGSSTPFQLTINITAVPTGSPSITSPETAEGNVNEPFKYQITATNSPTSFKIGPGSIPVGLVANNQSGALTGTPTEAGTYTVPISASNSLGSSSANLTITIGKAEEDNYTLIIIGIVFAIVILIIIIAVVIYFITRKNSNRSKDE